MEADPIYAIYINTLMYDGVLVLGNVPTNKTSVPLTTVKNYTLLYHNYYSVNGTFFDQVPWFNLYSLLTLLQYGPYSYSPLYETSVLRNFFQNLNIMQVDARVYSKQAL